MNVYHKFFDLILRIFYIENKADVRLLDNDSWLFISLPLSSSIYRFIFSFFYN